MAVMVHPDPLVEELRRLCCGIEEDRYRYQGKREHSARQERSCDEGCAMGSCC